MPSAQEVDVNLLDTDVARDQASDSRTFTYFIPNGDGTFDLVSETRQRVAPIGVANTLSGQAISIEVAGELAFA